jgi:hypothetical protein
VGEHQLCHEKGKTITDPTHKEALWKVLFGRKRKTQDEETSLPIPPVVETRPLSFYEEVSLH